MPEFDKDLRIFFVDATLNIRIGVSARSPGEAKKSARRLMEKAMNSGIFGTAGWNLDINRIAELEPVK